MQWFLQWKIKECSNSNHSFSLALKVELLIIFIERPDENWSSLDYLQMSFKTESEQVLIQVVAANWFQQLLLTVLFMFSTPGDSNSVYYTPSKPASSNASCLAIQPIPEDPLPAFSSSQQSFATKHVSPQFRQHPMLTTSKGRNQ